MTKHNSTTAAPAPSMPSLDERLKEHAAARVDAARAELREAIQAQRAIDGVTPSDDKVVGAQSPMDSESEG